MRRQPQLGVQQGRRLDQPAVEGVYLGGPAGADVLEHGARVVAHLVADVENHGAEAVEGEALEEEGVAIVLFSFQDLAADALVRHEGLEDAAGFSDELVDDPGQCSIGEDVAILAVQDRRERVDDRVDDELLQLENPQLASRYRLAVQVRRMSQLVYQVSSW